MKCLLKFEKASLHRYPVGKKYCRNRSHTVFETQAFLWFAIFGEKFENLKWPPFLASEIFVETWKG